MAAICGEGKIFGKLQRVHFLDLGRKFRRNRFGGGENFLKIAKKIAKSTFLRYPLGRKFRRNRSISHG